MTDSVAQFVPATDPTYGLLGYNPTTHKWVITENGVKKSLQAYITTIASSTSGSGTYTGASPATKAVGGYNVGDPITGTFSQIIQQLLAPYVNPAWSSFTVNSLSANVLDGTTLATSYTFNVATLKNSGTYTTATVFDITGGSTNLGSIALTAGNGSYALTTVGRKIEISGAFTSQVWNATFSDLSVGHTATYTSANITITPRQNVYLGSSASPVTFTGSSNVTTLAQAGGCSGTTSTPIMWVSSQTNIICSGTNQYLYIAIPNTRTFSGVGTNLDALGASVTFTSLGTVAVINADGSTTRTYTVYGHDHGSPFVSPNRIQIVVN